MFFCQQILSSFAKLGVDMPLNICHKPLVMIETKNIHSNSFHNIYYAQVMTTSVKFKSECLIFWSHNYRKSHHLFTEIIFKHL